MADLDEIYVFTFVNIHLHMHTIYISTIQFVKLVHDS